MKAARVAVTIAAIVAVEFVVCALAATPVVALWAWLIALPMSPAARVLLYGALAVPSYLLFALLLMPLSALAMRLTGARSPERCDTPIADMDWPLMQWARYVVSIRIVSFLAGGLFRGSPVWSAYLRWNGARIGRRVYVNTIYLSDHNLLEIGDDVAIGDGVHLSGHTVERGALRTARVRVGTGVTIGLNALVDIGADIGDGCQVGAMSVVPKFERLDPGGVYAGIPARRIDRPEQTAG